MAVSLLPKFPPNNRPPRVDAQSGSDSDNSAYTPPYPGVRLSRRAPVYKIESPNPSSILNPSISMVVAIEWDSQIGRTLRMWKQWTWFRITRSWKDCCFPRGLQMVQNLLVVIVCSLCLMCDLTESSSVETFSPDHDGYCSYYCAVGRGRSLQGVKSSKFVWDYPVKCR